ncbi:lysophospholipid acyltransferase family protein [Vibrio mediterranei]|uniref:lysophospholipid acyltransferase family protein n=1 Tax=Vibrio mediterranei TaxID=689 RepID=UPI00148B85F0|nr:lysophospholipid acyltransferase family protein [Vibrio mediterranei]NOH28702.1 lysophospholipid acyltransferase family protein [Vibrio mediterranei]
MDTTSPFRLPRRSPLGLAENVTEWATGLSVLDRLYAQRPADCDTESFLRFTLDILGIDYHIEAGISETIPKTGATIIVANHPLGCVEGVILAEVLLQIRKDVKILANEFLKLVPELEPLFIGVDVFNGTNAHRSNSKALRQANQHLELGGLLLVFPAGEVSQLVDRKSLQLEDKQWSRSVSTLIKRNQATTVPVHIGGVNSKHFYLAGKVHPMLRTAMLGRELLNKKNTAIRISIGNKIKFKEVSSLDSQQLVSYLRLNTYLLNQQHPERNHSSLSSHQRHQAIASETHLSELLEDIELLPQEHLLLTSGEFEVYCTSMDYIPAVMREIGRIREINFRQVGEGTGQSLDIDQFDQLYQHLFVWDKEKQKLVGAYRLGLVDELIKQGDIRALYSRTLFNFEHSFLNTMGKSIEMGRSVVAEEYQKSMSALLLLWKGIAEFVRRHPNYTHLFGPVSISNDYSDIARQLLTDTMTLHHYDNDSARYVSASNPPKQNRHRQWCPQTLSALADVQLLSRVISRLDTGKSVPVLLRQYLNLNGKLVCFNVDPNFNDALDGLIVVDLTSVPHKSLASYMGSEYAKQYLNKHNALSI